MECLYERLMRSVVKTLSGVSRETEKQFVESFEKIDAELAEEIKNRLFVFDDFALLDDRSVQKFLRQVETEELAKGLKGAKTEVQEKIFRNMSKRAASLLQEEMEHMGPVRLKDVEEAQLRFISIVRDLESKGEITVPRSRGDELVV